MGKGCHWIEAGMHVMGMSHSTQTYSSRNKERSSNFSHPNASYNALYLIVSQRTATSCNEFMQKRGGRSKNKDCHNAFRGDSCTNFASFILRC